MTKITPQALQSILNGKIDIANERTWSIVIKIQRPNDPDSGANVAVLLVDDKTQLEFAQLGAYDVDWGGSLTVGNINRAFNISVG